MEQYLDFDKLELEVENALVDYYEEVIDENDLMDIIRKVKEARDKYFDQMEENE